MSHMEDDRCLFFTFLLQLPLRNTDRSNAMEATPTYSKSVALHGGKDQKLQYQWDVLHVQGEKVRYALWTSIKVSVDLARASQVTWEEKKTLSEFYFISGFRTMEGELQYSFPCLKEKVYSALSYKLQTYRKYSKWQQGKVGKYKM